MSVDQRPNNANIHGAFEQLMFSISSTEQASTSPAYYRFRYICDMYVGGNLKARVKVYLREAKTHEVITRAVLDENWNLADDKRK